MENKSRDSYQLCKAVMTLITVWVQQLYPNIDVCHDCHEKCHPTHGIWHLAGRQTTGLSCTGPQHVEAASHQYFTTHCH